MKEIFEQYGAVIITVIAVIAFIAVINWVTAVNGTDGGIIGKAFNDLIQKFLTEAGASAIHVIR